MKLMSIKKLAASAVAAALVMAVPGGASYQAAAALVDVNMAMPSVAGPRAAAPVTSATLPILDASMTRATALGLPVAVLMAAPSASAAPVATSLVAAKTAATSATPTASRESGKASSMSWLKSVVAGRSDATAFDNSTTRADMGDVTGSASASASPLAKSTLSSRVSNGWTKLNVAVGTMMLASPAFATNNYDDSESHGIFGSGISWWNVAAVLVAIPTIVTVFRNIFTVPQGHVAVIERFGKYHSIRTAGLNFKIPFIDRVYEIVSLQKQSKDLPFTATTDDQASVHFKAMILYNVADGSEETIKKAAYSFIDQAAFMQTLTQSIEGSVRSFVATKKQAEVMKLRQEIVSAVKEHLDATLASWGYHLVDIQINEITFDDAITKAMNDVVASAQFRTAATNKGEALLIEKTKEAEATGAAIKIAAEAERLASESRGKGVAAYRAEVAKGMQEAADMMKGSGMNPEAAMMFGMWMETLNNMARNPGATIFLDGAPEAGIRTVREFMARFPGSQTPAAPKTDSNPQ